MNQISKLVEEYQHWLHQKTTLREVGSSVEITTPFLDRHNDYIQIYAQEENGKITLSDDGYTIDDLELSGCSLNTKSRQAFLQQTLNGFGVNQENNALLVKTDKKNFAISKHNLIQAIISVGDMFFTSKAVVHNFFTEDIELWLEESDIRFSSSVSFPGKSGFFHNFDFLIPKSKTKPERIIKAINRPDKDKVQLLAFAWTDTKQARQSHSKAYAVLNDTERAPSADVLSALNNYDIATIPWSAREKYRSELAA